MNPACPTAAQGSGRVNCALGSFSDNTNIGDSHYNSMQATLNRRFTSNVQAQVAYTFSKCIDNDGGGGGGGNTTNSGGSAAAVNSPENPYNASIDRGLCGFDFRHTLRVNGLWALPFHGNRVVEGWQISGIETRIAAFRSTSPREFRARFRAARITQLRVRLPDSAGQRESVVQSGLLCAATFRHAGEFGAGCRDRSALSGTDAAVLKDTRICVLNVQFRAELFNVFNHANFGLPVGQLSAERELRTVSSAQLSSIVGTPRQVQLALKLIF